MILSDIVKLIGSIHQTGRLYNAHTWNILRIGSMPITFNTFAFQGEKNRQVLSLWVDWTYLDSILICSLVIVCKHHTLTSCPFKIGKSGMLGRERSGFHDWFYIIVYDKICAQQSVNSFLSVIMKKGESYWHYCWLSLVYVVPIINGLMVIIGTMPKEF